MYDALLEFRYYQCRLQGIEQEPEQEDDETPATPKFDAGRMEHLLDTLKQPLPYEQSYFETYLLRLLTVKGLPFDVFSCDIFQDMMAHVHPGYKIPGTDALQQKLDDAVRTKRIAITQYIHMNVAQCAITADGWTSADQRKFFGVTLHFVTSNYHMASMVIGMERVHNSQTAENLLRYLTRVVDTWNLNEKLICGTTDQGANIKKTFRLYRMQENINTH